VTKSTVISTVSASGQVSAGHTLNLAPKASGTIVYVGVVPGQKVAAGTLIAEVDPTDAQKNVRDAQANLLSAQISLEKLQEPATALTLTQAQNAVTNAQAALVSAYTSASADVSSAFLTLPNAVGDLHNILLGNDVGRNSSNLDFYESAVGPNDSRGTIYGTTANQDYVAAQAAYDTAFADYQALGYSPSNAAIEKILAETTNTTQLIAKSVKSTSSLIQLYSDVTTLRSQTPNSGATTALNTLNSYTTKLNSLISQLTSDTNSLIQDKQSVIEKQQSLDETKAGPNTLDLQSTQLSVTKAQNALQDAKEALANYFVYAPFAGTIGSVSVQKYDQASGTVATLITTQQVADLSLNEVDATKVKLGDKATLTFDAIPDLTLTGSVVVINPVGTVSQGVVTYDIQIAFDTQDSRIKTGMSINADIQAEVHQDVLTVPSSAVKTTNGQSFVQVFETQITAAAAESVQGVVSSVAPVSVPVEIGISDDSNVEIVSGLTEGEQVVVRTTTGTAATKTTTTTSSRGGFGGGASLRL